MAKDKKVLTRGDVEDIDRLIGLRIRLYDIEKRVEMFNKLDNIVNLVLMSASIFLLGCLLALVILS